MVMLNLLLLNKKGLIKLHMDKSDYLKLYIKLLRYVISVESSLYRLFDSIVKSNIKIHIKYICEALDIKQEKYYNTIEYLTFNLLTIRYILRVSSKLLVRFSESLQSYLSVLGPL